MLKLLLPPPLLEVDAMGDAKIKALGHTEGLPPQVAWGYPALSHLKCCMSAKVEDATQVDVASPLKYSAGKASGG